MSIKSLSKSSLLNFEKYSSMLAGNTAYNSNPLAYDLLQTEILTTAETSVTFSSLNGYAADYQHLQLRISSRDSGPYYSAAVQVQLNGVTSSSYIYHALRGGPTSITTSTGLSQSSIRASIMTGASAVSNNFGVGIVDILDPFNSNKNTTLRGFTAYTDLQPQVWLTSGFFNNTASITEIKLTTNGTGFDTNSRFSLYGLKGA